MSEFYETGSDCLHLVFLASGRKPFRTYGSLKVDSSSFACVFSGVGIWSYEVLWFERETKRNSEAIL